MTSTLLDTQNFKINSNGRAVQDSMGIVKGKKVQIKVKINPEGDVREYVSGVPAFCVGQQLFTFVAALRETAKAGKSLPSDQSKLHDAIDTLSGETDLQKYKNYLTKTKVQFAGCHSSSSQVFDDIGTWGYCWLDDGTRVNLNATTRGVARRDETMGYSVRTN